MQLFDFHCDTLLRAYTEKQSLDNSKMFHITFNKANQYDKWCQLMAVWIDDTIRGTAAFDLVQNCYKLLCDSINKSEYDVEKYDDFSLLANSKNKLNVVLAVEGGAAINGDLQNISKLKKMGVRFLTLTWNAANEIGDGAGVDNPGHITSFGKQAIKELENNGIVIDVSHASDPLFWDVAEIAAKPYIATHSNSRAVCNHKRNLTDDQFLQICRSGGIVGLNFCDYFLKENGSANIYDILQHTEHFLALNGSKNIVMGGDFDGADMPNGITGIESMSSLYELFLKENYNEDLVKDIFWNNGMNFCENFDNKAILV